MFYLFSSNARDRYIQDILNITALPKSALYQFRYEDSIVDQPLLDDLNDPASRDKHKGEDALIVFVVQTKGKKPLEDSDVAYFPLRRAKIRDLNLEGKVLRVQFEVGEYVNWENLEPQSQDKRDQIICGVLESGHRPPRKYVVSVNSKPTIGIFAYAVPARQSHAWQQAVTALSRIPDFDHTIFYRLASLKEIRETFKSKFLHSIHLSKVPDYAKVERKLLDVLPEISGYQIKSGSTNLLYLDFYHVKDPDEIIQESSICAIVDSALFSYSPKPIQITFRYDNRPVPLVTTPLNQDIYTGLDIQLIRSKSEQSVQAPEDNAPIRAPDVSLLIKLSYHRVLVYVLFGFLFLGQLLTAMAGRMTDIFNIFNAAPTLVAIAPRFDSLFILLGPIISTFILFLLLKRLPAIIK